jgi:hypothetical protein
MREEDKGPYAYKHHGLPRSPLTEWTILLENLARVPMTY